MSWESVRPEKVAILYSFDTFGSDDPTDIHGNVAKVVGISQNARKCIDLKLRSAFGNIKITGSDSNPEESLFGWSWYISVFPNKEHELVLAIYNDPADSDEWQQYETILKNPSASKEELNAIIKYVSENTYLHVGKSLGEGNIGDLTPEEESKYYNIFENAVVGCITELSADPTGGKRKRKTKKRKLVRRKRNNSTKKV